MIGDKSRFAVEIGDAPVDGTQLRRVDLWAADQWWTCDDNFAYLPQFCVDVQATIDWLQSGRDLSLPFPGLSSAESHRRLRASRDGSRERFWFAHWGPTTDNVSAHLFRDGDRILIPFEFWRAEHHLPQQFGTVFVAELSETELLTVLQRLVDALVEIQAA